jgi:hypothetical protein
MTKPGVVFVGAAQDGLPTVAPRRFPSIRAWAFAAAATSFTETASGGPLITSIVVVGALDRDFLAEAAEGRASSAMAKVKAIKARLPRQLACPAEGTKENPPVCTLPVYEGTRPVSPHPALLPCRQGVKRGGAGAGTVEGCKPFASFPVLMLRADEW